MVVGTRGSRPAIILIMEAVVGQHQITSNSECMSAVGKHDQMEDTGTRLCLFDSTGFIMNDDDGGIELDLSLCGCRAIEGKQGSLMSYVKSP